MAHIIETLGRLLTLLYGMEASLQGLLQEYIAPSQQSLLHVLTGLQAKVILMEIIPLSA